MTEITSISDPRHWLAYVPRTLERISPLYAHIYREMQEDREIFSLLTLIDPDQPIPVLFLSVINFLLFGHTEHPFAQFYPTLTATPRPPNEAYPSFQAFCLEHKEALQRLLPMARLQTNEVTRCANLLPAFDLISTREDRRPLALIEIGSSAGLLLNWHRYFYTYNQGYLLGDEASSVQISCTIEGEQLPVPLRLPPMAQCLGIELNPLDINNERDVRWLRSCIWPEERKRYQLLDAAIALARQYPPQMLTGDACHMLPNLLPTIPLNHPICLFHSFALNQGPVQVKERIIQTLVDASLKRTIYRISIEADPLKKEHPRLELFTYRNGDLFHYEWLAECDFHGERMTWLAPLYY
jgi:hypothetical protein